MIALAAVFHLRSARTARTCRADDFFRGLLTTALEPDEVLAEIELPGPAGPRTGHGFAEVARRHGDFALVGACAVLALDAGGVCRAARLVIFGAGDRPHLARAGAALIGERPAPAHLAEVGRAGAGEIDARDELHAPAAIRLYCAPGPGTTALCPSARACGARNKRLRRL